MENYDVYSVNDCYLCKTYHHYFRQGGPQNTITMKGFNRTYIFKQFFRKKHYLGYKHDLLSHCKWVHNYYWSISYILTFFWCLWLANFSTISLSQLLFFFKVIRRSDHSILWFFSRILLGILVNITLTIQPYCYFFIYFPSGRSTFTTIMLLTFSGTSDITVSILTFFPL